MMKRKLTIVLSAAFLLLSYAAKSQDGLFISEIIDPADDYSGRFIELFNAGTAPVDFSATPYYLSRQSNGGTSWGDLLLEGSVPAGETFVIGGSGFADLYGFVPDQETGILIGNGDDTYCLFSGGDHTGGTLHDIYGAIDVDGTGEPWEYVDQRAVRIAGVAVPNAVWTAAEWEITQAGVAGADPGIHHGEGGGDLPVPGVYGLSVTNDTVAAGDTAIVPVSVSYLTTSDNVISWQFEVSYDSTLLDYNSCTLTGTLSEGGTVAVNSDSSGWLSVRYMHTEPLTGEGAITGLQFTALAPGAAGVLISGAFLNNHPVEDPAGGEVVVMSAVPPAAAITYDDTLHRFADTLLITATFSEQMDPAVPVTFSLQGAVTATDVVMNRVNDTVYAVAWPVPKAEGDVEVVMTGGSDLWGGSVLPSPVTGDSFSIVPFTPGDVDDDGLILAYDAALTLQHSVGLDPLPDADPLPWEPWRDSTANVDGAPGITANDAALILQVSAGLVSGFGDEAKKGVENADVSIEVVGKEIVFYSHGALVGLNVSVADDAGLLGTPQGIAETFLSALNISATDYHVGLCTATPLPEGASIMRIPFDGSGMATFSLRINKEERVFSVDLATGMDEVAEGFLLVYPNPAGERVFVDAGGQEVPDGTRIRMTDQQGRRILEAPFKGQLREIDLSGRPAGGLLYLQIISPAGEVVAGQKVLLTGDFP
jgi:hypothetical protein